MGTSPPPSEALPLDADHDEPRTLVEHLAELRTRLIRCLVALAIGAAVAMPFQDFWLKILVAPALPHTGKLKFLGLTEPFFIELKLSLVVGLLFVLPYVVWQTWLFVAPALYRREQKWVLRLSGFSLGLFWFGVVFAYVVAVPIAVRFFTNFGKGDMLESNITLGNYIGFASWMLLGFGFVFQLPLVLIFLIKTGIVTRERMAKNRRIVIVILTVVAAAVTPTGDPLSWAIMFVPLYLLFELSLLLTRPAKAAAPPDTGDIAVPDP